MDLQIILLDEERDHAIVLKEKRRLVHHGHGAVLLGREDLLGHVPRTHFKVLLAARGIDFGLGRRQRLLLAAEHRQMVQHLADVLIGPGSDLVQRLRFQFDALLEADGHHGAADLLHARLTELEIVAVVGQTAHFRVLSVVADANDWDFRRFDEPDQLLHAAAVLVAGHPVHLVHDEHAFLAVHGRSAVGEGGQRLAREQLGHVLVQQPLAARVRRVHLHQVVAQLFAHQMRRRRFTYRKIQHFFFVKNFFFIFFLCNKIVII